MKIRLILAVIALSCWGCGSFMSPTVSSPTFLVGDVVLATNGQRTANGLHPLIENQKLDLVADYKMKDMFARQYFGHYGPDGTSGVTELLKKFNYYGVGGENLASGNFKNADELVAAWMASPGHRDNILYSDYRDIGVAVGYDVFNGKRTMIVVQIFGIPAGSYRPSLFNKNLVF